jgi:hypothetical protein
MEHCLDDRHGRVMLLRRRLQHVKARFSEDIDKPMAPAITTHARDRDR